MIRTYSDLMQKSTVARKGVGVGGK
jgi:hypothetical protein